MKRLYFPGVIFLTMAIFACKKNVISPSESDISQSSKNTLFIHLKDCIVKTFGPETITVCFDSVISESRCPKNATCVWQGTAVAGFSLLKDNIKYPFTLSTVDLQGLFSSETIVAGYKIKFVDLTPYPELFTPPVPSHEIKAEIELTKQ